jgi:hypothetical protein
MPSLIVTPPEKIKEPGSYLVVNAAPDDLEMVLRWLQINGVDLIINLYYEHMNNLEWLGEVADMAEHILVESSTNPATLVQLPENKITRIGQDQEYSKAIDYFINNG